eukprot:GHVL01017762.1.p1 GENE.GHVL01017762.1~~GHVL01017762.1.p1  ORF type:complete len:709 (-),score=91.01 GHVL01017762.1:30-2156(-)
MKFLIFSFFFLVRSHDISHDFSVVITGDLDNKDAYAGDTRNRLMVWYKEEGSTKAFPIIPNRPLSSVDTIEGREIKIIKSAKDDEFKRKEDLLTAFISDASFVYQIIILLKNMSAQSLKGLKDLFKREYTGADRDSYDIHGTVIIFTCAFDCDIKDICKMLNMTNIGNYCIVDQQNLYDYRGEVLYFGIEKPKRSRRNEFLLFNIYLTNEDKDFSQSEDRMINTVDHIRPACVVFAYFGNIEDMNVFVIPRYRKVLDVSWEDEALKAFCIADSHVAGGRGRYIEQRMAVAEIDTPLYSLYIAMNPDESKIKHGEATHQSHQLTKGQIVLYSGDLRHLSHKDQATLKNDESPLGFNEDRRHCYDEWKDTGKPKVPFLDCCALFHFGKSEATRSKCYKANNEEQIRPHSIAYFKESILGKESHFLYALRKSGIFYHRFHVPAELPKPNVVVVKYKTLQSFDSNEFNVELVAYLKKLHYPKMVIVAGHEKETPSIKFNYELVYYESTMWGNMSVYQRKFDTPCKCSKSDQSDQNVIILCEQNLQTPLRIHFGNEKREFQDSWGTFDLYLIYRKDNKLEDYEKKDLLGTKKKKIEKYEIVPVISDVITTDSKKRATECKTVFAPNNSCCEMADLYPDKYEHHCLGKNNQTFATRGYMRGNQIDERYIRLVFKEHDLRYDVATAVVTAYEISNLFIDKKGSSPTHGNRNQGIF